MIFPGSGLFGSAGTWIVAAEMVETSRLFARAVATIDPGWLEPLAGGLCRSTHRTRAGTPARGEVVATEQVTLFGLVIVPGRTVAYGRIRPGRGGRHLHPPCPGGGRDRATLRLPAAQPGSDRPGRRATKTACGAGTCLIDEQDLAAFYRRRLPGVCDAAFARAPHQNPGRGRVPAHDRGRPHCATGRTRRSWPFSRSGWPWAPCAGGRATASSRVPGGDGVTLRVPAALAPEVPPAGPGVARAGAAAGENRDPGAGAAQADPPDGWSL